MSYLGTNKIGKMYLGSTEIAKAYLGSDLVYKKKPALPYDAEVEYLQFTGTQGIDTGIVVGENDVIEIDIKFIKNTDSTYNQAFLANDGTNATFLRSSQQATRLYYRFGSGTSQNAAFGTITSRHIYSMRKNVLEIDGNVFASSIPYVAVPNDTIKIGLSGSSSLKAEFYSFRVTDSNNTKKTEIIPVRVGQVGYMYDKVSGNLLGKGAEDGFIIGNDKN